MARTARSTPFASDEFTAEEQAAFDEMRANDSAPADPAPARTPRAPRLPALEPDEVVPPDDPQPLPADANPNADADPGQDPAATPQDETIRKVNGALKEERDRRRDIEQQLAEERRQRQVLDERTNLLLQRIAGAPAPTPAPEAPKIPERDQDPIGHFDQRIAPLEQAVRELAQGTQQQRQMTQAEQVMQQVVGACQAQEERFRAEAPDYDSAAQFLRESRDRQLQAIGMDNPLERRNWIDNEARQIAVRAVQTGKNFAQMIYATAAASGYTKAPAASAEDAAAAAAGAAAVDPAARLEIQRQGQQQARSLGTARGSAPPPALTAQRLAEMPEAQFNAMLEKMTPGQKRQLFGD